MTITTYLFKLMIIDAMIFDISSASLINSFIFSLSTLDKFVSLIKQSQYLVSFDDFKAML